MRRFLPLVSVAIVALIGLVALGARPGVGAQEATPVTEAVFEGVTVEPLAGGSVPAYPPLPADFILVRARIAPGGRIAVPAGDPSLALNYVESGTLISLNTAPVVVVRGAAMATPGAQAQEQLPANTEVTLQAGDSFVGPPGVGGEVRNEGTEEATILVALVAPAMAATPTP